VIAVYLIDDYDVIIDDENDGDVASSSTGETILAHTNEFIGGRETVTTMMKARSSMGRNFIEVCKCAGWGDIGYVNRWTMEITNNSRFYSIPLVVGRRIAQIVFFDSEGRSFNYLLFKAFLPLPTTLLFLKVHWMVLPMKRQENINLQMISKK
jgi:deoxycytidine triphosphate deaminase